ncbi:hypothetical protein [Kitasatospora sp. KL5]|uniref:hypothetical protein n=1 Tax=Kitasatospora sp. KL5 TaxID=3425125 RepID=UPI003D6E226F
MAAPLLALVVAGGTACGGSGGGGPAPAPGAAVSSPPSPGDPSSSASAVPSSEDLRSALLSVEDLGPAFVESLPASGAGDSATSGCPLVTAILNGQGAPRPGAVHEQAEFTTFESSPYVGESLLAEEQQALADDHGRVSEALRNCHELTLESGATAVTFTLTPVRFGGIGATAVRMDGALDGILLNGYLAVERIGPAVLTFWYFQAGNISSELASAVYRAAADKAAQVLVAGTDGASAASAGV